MTMEGDGQSQTWHVVFYDMPDDAHWWARFLRRGFRHCFAYRHLTNEYALMVECLSNQIFVEIIDNAQLEAILNRATEAWSVTLPVNTTRHLTPRILTCVGVLKHMLGVSWGYVWTPWQLRCALSEGAKGVLFYARDDNGGQYGRRIQQTKGS